MPEPSPIGKPRFYTYTFSDVDGSDIDDAPNAITIGSRGFIWEQLTWQISSCTDINLRIWDEGRGESFMNERIPLAAIDDNLPYALTRAYPFRPHSIIHLEAENDSATDNIVVEIIFAGYEPLAAELAQLLTEFGE